MKTPFNSKGKMGRIGDVPLIGFDGSLLQLLYPYYRNCAYFLSQLCWLVLWEPIFMVLSKMLSGVNLFSKQLRNHASGIDLLNDYRWLKNFEILLHANCNLIPLNLEMWRYTRYIIAIYSTVFMHMLLNGVARFVNVLYPDFGFDSFQLH